MATDLNKFVFNSIDNAKQAQASEVEQWLTLMHVRLREDGVRFALETARREQEDEFLGRFREIIAPEFDYELRRLFRGSEEEEPSAPDRDLANFWLLRIPGFTYIDVEGSIFDAAYSLWDALGLRSAEPDIPFVANLGGGHAPPTNLLAAQSIDRAWSLRAMNVPEAWDYSIQKQRPPQGKDVLIGHPDTGYTDHVDLDMARVVASKGFDFVDNKQDPRDPLNYMGTPGHGLATASVIMSGGTVIPPPVRGEGGTGPPGKVTGVAPQTKLIPIRSEKIVGWVIGSNVAQSIHHAVRQECHVISISLGGRAFNALKVALLDAVAKNVIVVAAAGNNVRMVVWPARYNACIAMAASNINSAPWSGSSRGGAVDMTAPGEQVWRAFKKAPNDPITRVGPSDGTSYATANAAGTAALWLAHFGRGNLIKRMPGSILQEIFRNALKQTARTPQGWDQRKFGTGIIDAFALLRTSPLPPPTPPGSGAAPTSTTAFQDVANLIPNLGTRDPRAFWARVFGLEEDNLDNWFERFGQEITVILTDLIMSGDLMLSSLSENRRIVDAAQADILRGIIRRQGSHTLRSKMP